MKSNLKEFVKFKTNAFYYYATEYQENMTSDSEIKNIDMTEPFWDEIKEEIKNDELVDININAKVRMGKSTVGIYLGKEIVRLLKRFGKRKDAKFGIDNIARDQQEYSKMMRDPNTNHTVIVTDEVNELEETGENVTVERALNNVFSNVQAGRYVHRISCSPKDVADPNADVFLEIVSIDKQNKITHCHLYYRLFKAGSEYMQLLGFVNFNVKELVDIWEKHVKKRFLKPNRSPRDERSIREWRKKDFYTEYMIRKYEKMELITKEGILRPRMLDYAEIILSVEESLKSLARFGILNKGTIKAQIKAHCRKMKIPTSIVGEELMTQEVDGILNLRKSFHKITTDMTRTKKQFQEKKIGIEDYELKMLNLEDIRKTIMEVINNQINDLERLKEVNDEYNLRYEKEKRK